MKRATGGPFPNLDFRRLELERASRVLRDWALGVTATFCGTGAAPPPSRLLELAPCLRLRRPGRSERRQLEERAGRKLGSRPTLLRPLSWALARDLPPDFPPRRLHAPARHPAMPDALWPWLGELAWRQPELVHGVAHRLSRHLLARQPLADGEVPVPVLHPRTWWLVLDLAGVPALQNDWGGAWGRRLRSLAARRGWQRAAGWRWPRGRGRRGRIAARLSEVARQQYRDDDSWAGDWDRWWIAEILQDGGLPRAPSDEPARQWARYLIRPEGGEDV